MKSTARTNLDHSTLIAAARWLLVSVGAVGFALLGYSALARKSHDDVDAVTVKPTASSDPGMRSSSFSATTRPIEQLKVGDRVLARNPEVTPEERAAYVEPEWSEWVHLSLEMPKPDGYVLSIEMLRPESWVRNQLALVTAKRQGNDSSKPTLDSSSNAAEKMSASEVPHSTHEESSAEAGAPESSGFLPYRKLYLDLAATSAAIETETDEVIGAVVELDLPELGLTGPAIINSIETAPEVKRGEGRVITATFHHSSGDVIDLVIGDDKSTETIGTTSNHPFWSVDRQEYVQAGSLHQGERVLTLQGDTKRIVSHLARPGPQPVFNLEVFAEHVYYVGGDGVLVHNNHEYDITAQARTGHGAFGYPAGINRGHTTKLENSAKSLAAADFENGTVGAATDVATRMRVVPTLKFDNPNPRGRNFIRFDGQDGNVMIDRKLNVTTKSKQLRDLQRISQALIQNPNYAVVIEVPDAKVYRAAVRALSKAGVTNIDLRIGGK
ncbi:MAG: polymorphic toxin-type HINT domain-containing protein [Pirellulales bacterium]